MPNGLIIAIGKKPGAQGSDMPPPPRRAEAKPAREPDGDEGGMKCPNCGCEFVMKPDQDYGEAEEEMPA